MNWKDMDKKKKFIVAFIIYIVLFFVVMLVAAHVKHKPFDPNFIGIVVASLLCALATVYIKKL